MAYERPDDSKSVPSRSSHILPRMPIKVSPRPSPVKEAIKPKIAKAESAIMRKPRPPIPQVRRIYVARDEIVKKEKLEEPSRKKEELIRRKLLVE